jgi:hypothetical protein
MEFNVIGENVTSFGGGNGNVERPGAVMLSTGNWYDPLHDDAQAMALVKKFQVELIAPNQTYLSQWRAYTCTDDGDCVALSADIDLNRTICECVAKMQQDKQRAAEIVGMDVG